MAVPVNSTAPTIAGTPSVGHVMRCWHGDWTNTPTSYGYQWKRAGVDISSATADTYTLVTADNTTAITCNVTATNGSGTSGATASDSVTCSSALSVTNWDPTARQAWEPDTVFLFDPDQEATFWSTVPSGMLDASGTFVSSAACNPWRGGSPYTVTAGKYRRGIVMSNADNSSIWIPGPMLPATSWTIEFWVKCSMDWVSAPQDIEWVSFGSHFRPGYVTIRNNAGRVFLEYVTPDDSNALADATLETAGTWVSVAATYDGTDVSLYVAGAFINSHTLIEPFAWAADDERGFGGLTILRYVAGGSGAGLDIWTVSDLRISRVARDPSGTITATPASTCTFTDTTAGSSTPYLAGAVHHFGSNTSDLAVADTLHVPLLRCDKLDSAVPIVAGGTDTDHPVAGQSGDWSYNMGPVDHLCQYLEARGCALYLNFGSCPDILGGSISPLSLADCADPDVIGGNYTFWAPDVPSDFTDHANICADIYNYIVTAYPALPVPYVGFANEPNLGGSVFWAGTSTQMFDLYAEFAPAIKAIDAAQKVGGIEVTNYDDDKTTWVQGFLTYCGANAVPVDFVSIHSYVGTLGLPFYAKSQILGWAAAASLPDPEVAISEWGWQSANRPDLSFPWGDSNYWLNDWGAAFQVAFALACQEAGVAFATYFHAGVADPAGDQETGLGILDGTNHVPFASANALRVLSELMR